MRAFGLVTYRLNTFDLNTFDRWSELLASHVRLGKVYKDCNTGNYLIGTLVVPSKQDVRKGVVYDNGTVGTLDNVENVYLGGGDFTDKRIAKPIITVSNLSEEDYESIEEDYMNFEIIKLEEEDYMNFEIIKLEEEDYD